VGLPHFGDSLNEWAQSSIYWRRYRLPSEYSNIQNDSLRPTGTVSQYSVSGGGAFTDGKAVSIVIGSGLRWRIKSWDVEPEVRYTRIRSDLTDSSGNPFEVIRAPNQFEFMLGITVPPFGSHKGLVK
jgi:hypothetical protein